MKRLFIYMFMVLFCATACSNEELTENTPIFVDFSVFDSNEWNEVSRGDALTTSTLYSKGFGVFAYYKATTKPDFINNSKVTSDNSGKTWNYSPKKYWPHDQADKIDFYAYAPYSAMQQIDGTTMSFTVNQAVSEQIDFVWSNSKTTNLNKNTQVVNFKFQHSLARIGFMMYPSVQATSMTSGVRARFKVNNIKLSATGNPDNGVFYSSGKIDIANTSNTPAWSNCSGKLKFDLTGANFSTTNNSGLILTQVNNQAQAMVNANSSYIMVIPQDLSTEGFDVYIEYQVELLDKNGNVYNSHINVGTGTINLNLQSGTTYMINILMTLEEAVVDEHVSITEWVDGGEVIMPGIVPDIGQQEL